MDYSFTSSPLQVAALVDRLRSLRIPAIALLYCPHHDWHVAWQAHDAERRGAWLRREGPVRWAQSLSGGPGPWGLARTSLKKVVK